MSSSRESESPNKVIDGKVSDQVVQKCPKCNHYIQAGSTIVEGVHYHPKCFTCMKCGTVCRVEFYQRVNNKFYCQPCVDKTPELYHSLRAAKQAAIDAEKARQQAIIDEENARQQAILDAEKKEKERQHQAQLAAEAEASRRHAELTAANNAAGGKPKKDKKPNSNNAAGGKPKKDKKSNSRPNKVVEQQAAAEDVWVEVKDESNGRSYWWNQVTNETTALDAPKPTGNIAARSPPLPASAAGCNCTIS